MKLLIISQYYYPEQFQINEIAPELVKRGHDVTVVTGLPNYPQGEIFGGYKLKEYDEIIDGVRVLRCRQRPRKHGAINLIINYISFALRASKLVRNLSRDYDIVICYEVSPITMIFPAYVYKKMNKKPLLTYCLDIWPEAAKDHLNISALYSIVKLISRILYKTCDHIAVTSRPFMDYLEKENGVDRSKMSYIPQHADMSMLDVDLAAPDNGVVDFLYAGNMGKAQTLDVIIRAVAELKDRNDFVVHMVGDGSRRKELEALVQKFGVQNKVIFYGNRSRNSMPGFYKEADALLITLRGNNAVGNTMPGKLQMYMTTGKPILGAINGAANEVIKESGCGRCVSAGDYKGLSKIMADFIDNPDDYNDCGRKAKAYFKDNFTLVKYCDMLEEQMKRLVVGR